MPATPDDLRRATPDEATRALIWQSQQGELAALRAEALDSLVGDHEAADENFERWAALLPSPGDTDDREDEP